MTNKKNELLVASWVRHDGAKMKERVVKVKGGIRSKMFINGVKVIDTFSKRPYKLAQSCDGTIDDCVHALFIDFCHKLDLDAQELYYRAYPESEKDNCYDLEAQINIITRANKEGVEYPEIWNEQAFKGLVESLTEINNHSLVGVIEELNLF